MITTISVNASGLSHLLVSSDDSLNNGVTNLVVNMFVISTADEKLVLKQNNETRKISLIHQACEHILLLIGYSTFPQKNMVI